MVTLRSDSKGKFGEGSREPMPGIGVPTEFAVTAAAVLERHVAVENVTANDHNHTNTAA